MKRHLCHCVFFYALFSFLTLTFTGITSYTLIALTMVGVIFLLLYFLYKNSVFLSLTLIVLFSLTAVIKTQYVDLHKLEFAQTLDGEYVKAEGKVTDFKKSSRYLILTVDCNSINSENTNTNISVITTQNDLDVDIGKRVTFSGELEYAFDSYSKGNQTFLTSFCNDVKVLDNTDFLSKISLFLRSEIRSVSQNFKYGALIDSLLIGDRSKLDPKITKDFNVLGISHLLSISGLHLSIVVMSFFVFLSKIGTTKYLKVSLSIFLALLYMFITGFGVSVVRAGQMMIVYLLSKLLRRANDSISALFLSVFLIVFRSSWALFSLSFQLSFLSTLGIIIFVPPVLRAYDKYNYERKRFGGFKIKLTEYVIITLYSTLSATLFTLPVTLTSFNSVSLISPLANLTVIFFAKYFLLFSVVGLILPVLFLTDPLGDIMFFLVELLVKITPESVGMDLGFVTLGAIIISIIAFLFHFFSRRVLTLPIAVTAVAIFFSVYNFTVSHITYDDVRVSAVQKRGCNSIYLSFKGESFLVDLTSSNSLNTSNITALIGERKTEEVDTLVVSVNKEIPIKRLDLLLTLFSPQKVFLLLPPDFDDFYPFTSLCEEKGCMGEVIFSGEYELFDGAKVKLEDDICTVLTVEHFNNSIAFYKELSSDYTLGEYTDSDILFYDGEYPPDKSIHTELSHWRINEKRIVRE